MDKAKTAKYIYKSVNKALRKIIDKNGEGYLKPLKNKAWHSLALKEYTKLTMDLLWLLDKYSKKYKEIVEGKELVMKSDKKLTRKDIERIVREISEELQEDLEEFYEKSIKEDIILTAATLVAKDLGMAFNYNSYDKFTRDYLRDKKIRWANQVAQSTEDRIKKILVKGFEEGLGSYDIAELIHSDNIFSYNRAEAIARTEIVGACNYVDNVIYQLDDNIIGKKWSTTGDERTRLNHSYADGQIVPKEKPFIVGGYELMHPGDSSLGAPAEEVINCRCTTVAVFEGESLKSNTIYDEDDVGTVEWLERQDDDYQKSYLGNNKKFELFQHNKLKSEDLLLKIDEIAGNMTEKNGIIKERIDRKIKEISGMTPFEKVDLYHTNRKEYDKRRVFDENGKALYDLDLNIHRNLSEHRIAPHLHLWEDGKKEKGYRMPSREQVENNRDIISKVYNEKYYNEYIKAYDEKDKVKRQSILEKLTRSWYK